jgi:hypothetical protein
MPTIPDRAPHTDPFRGVVLRVGDDDLLAAAPSAGVDVIAEGELVLRYGVRYLGKAWLAIVPGLVAIDYGTFITGEDALDFLLHRSNLYPRAEVFGYRADGVDEQMFVRQLDIALGLQPLVYADLSATQAVASPIAFIGDAAAAPPRVSAHLPTYPTLDDWQQSKTET